MLSVSGARQFNLQDNLGNLGNLGNLACWALNLSFSVIAVNWVVPLYNEFYQLRAWSPLPDVWWTFVLAVFMYDFIYYWFHRLSHRFVLLWNVHSVHHQAHRLVPTLGMRSSLFDFAVVWLILGPMLWLGFNPPALITAISVHAMYQLFIHYDRSPALGALEWVLNTPNHHRLHHAVNPRYLDKNFGSMLIIWDRIFGTFVSQKEVPEIGVTGPCYIADPLRSNLAPWLTRGQQTTAENETALIPMQYGLIALLCGMVIVHEYWPLMSNEAVLLASFILSAGIFLTGKKRRAV